MIMYRIHEHVLSFYTQPVRFLELLEMARPKEHVVMVTFVTAMEVAKVHFTNFLLIVTYSFYLETKMAKYIQKLFSHFHRSLQKYHMCGRRTMQRRSLRMWKCRPLWRQWHGSLLWFQKQQMQMCRKCRSLLSGTKMFR